MKLEDNVCSLQLSKKLKELGVKQESIFYWIEHHLIGHTELRQGRIVNEATHCENFTNEYSAFTASELEEMLPAKLCDSMAISLIILIEQGIVKP